LKGKWEIQIKIRENQTKNRRKPNKKYNLAKLKYKKSEIQRIKKLLFCLDFAVLKFGFPRFFQKSGKSKQNIGEIQTKTKNPNKKSVCYCLDFTDFIP
jgi:hypothetical protein